jgi:corrinoid protein of di/trimethylamine methyltransferase
MASGSIEKLKKIVLDFDTDNAEKTAREAIAAGADPMECAKALTEGIRDVGEKFGTGELFLPDLVCASEVVKSALPVITAEIERQGKKRTSLGKVVIGTVFGDIHSIGKSLVATLLFASGFEVIDLGVNVKSADFLAAVEEHSPGILAMSALLTTTMAEQRRVIEGLKKEKVRDRVKVIVGGSPINQEFSDRIGADGYGATAPEGVKVVKRLLRIT